MAWVLRAAGLDTGAGWARLADTLGHADLPMLVLALLFIPLMEAVSAFKWYCLARARDLAVGYGRLLAFYLVGKFFSMTLPGGVGGDLIRVHLLGRETGRYADAAAVVLVERLTGLITLIACTLAAATLASTRLGAPWLFYALLAMAGGLLLALWPIADGRPLQGLRRRLPSLSGILEKLEKLRAALLLVGAHRHAVGVAFVNSALFYAAAILNTWVSLRVFDAQASLATMALAVPIMMFIMNLPVSMGNIGILEFAFTFTLTRFGVGAPEALALALLMRVKNLLAVAAGGAVYLALPAGLARRRELERELADPGLTPPDTRR